MLTRRHLLAVAAVTLGAASATLGYAQAQDK